MAGTPAAGEVGGPSRSLDARHYREIRSARYPLGLPDRSDATVLDAFEGAWLLIDHSPDGEELVGVADDYDEARAWLDQDRTSHADQD